MVSDLDAFAGPEDYTETDDSVGFSRIEAWEIDDIGTKGVVERIRARVGSNPVYLTIDIDTLGLCFRGF